MKKLLLSMALVANTSLADPPHNLVVNGNFDQDGQGWSQQQGAIAFWDTPDVDNNPFSGSIWIVDGYLQGTTNFRSVLGQYVAITHPGIFTIRFSAFAPVNQPMAKLAFLYTYRPDDTGGSIADTQHEILAKSDNWQTFELHTANLTPPGHLQIELGTFRTEDGDQFSGHFDKVIVSDDAVFLGSFD